MTKEDRIDSVAEFNWPGSGSRFVAIFRSLSPEIGAVEAGILLDRAMRGGELEAIRCRLPMPSRRGPKAERTENARRSLDSLIAEKGGSHE